LEEMEMKMRSIVVLLLLSVVIALVGGVTQARGNLTVWAPAWDMENWQAIEAMYEGRYNYNIEVENKGSLADIYQAVIASRVAGEVPDVVVVLQSSILPLHTNGVLRNMTGAADAWYGSGFTVVNFRGFSPGLFADRGFLVVGLNSDDDDSTTSAIGNLLSIAGEQMESGLYQYVPGEVDVLAMGKSNDDGYYNITDTISVLMAEVGIEGGPMEEEAIPNLGILPVKVNEGDELWLIGEVMRSYYYGDTVEDAGLNVIKCDCVFQPDDTLWATQWNLVTINWPDAWVVAKEIWDENPSPIAVAVIDCGLAHNHEDFEHIGSQWWGYQKGWNLVAGNNNPMDDQGHGTAVAGVIAAETNNNRKGIAGLARIKLIVIKAGKPKAPAGGGTQCCVTDRDFANAVEHARLLGAKIINYSFGGRATSPAERRAIRRATAHGILIVAPVGNDGVARCDWPARYNQVIAVSATTRTDTLWASSNFHARVELAAPGQDIPTTRWVAGATNRYWSPSGTSLAVPHVAAVAALVWYQHPKYSSSQVRQALQKTAVDLGAGGRDPSFGFGRIDAFAAVQYDTTTINWSSWKVPGQNRWEHDYVVYNRGQAPISGFKLCVSGAILSGSQILTEPNTANNHGGALHRDGGNMTIPEGWDWTIDGTCIMFTCPLSNLSERIMPGQHKVFKFLSKNSGRIAASAHIGWGRAQQDQRAWSSGTNTEFPAP
jgi:hypothetical protein